MNFTTSKEPSRKHAGKGCRSAIIATQNVLLLILLMIGFGSANAQCLPRSNFYWGEMLPNAGCSAFAVYGPFGPGEYFRMPVLQGGSYQISTCGSSIDTQITGFQGGTTATSIFYNDDNGPSCGGTSASIDILPNFTDYTRVQVSQYNCRPGGTASITVRVRQNNNLNFTNSAASMCAGQTRTLTAVPARTTATPQPGSGNQGAFSGNGVSGTTFTAPNLVATSAIFTLTYTFGYCTTTQTIPVFRAPSQANAGPSQTICSSTTTLAATNPSVGSGSWSVQSGPGTVTSSNSPTSGLAGLSAATPTILVWTVSNGPCTNSTDSVTITRNAAPTPAVAGNNQTLCDTSATLAGNAPAVGTGTWTLVSGTGTITTPSSPSSGVTGLAVGTNVFRWTTSNGVCATSTSDVTITVDEAPTVAIAGQDQSICADTTSLIGNVPTVGTGQWTLISGSGSITAPGSPNSGLTNVGVGTNEFVWTTSNGVCPSSADTITVTRFADPSVSVAGQAQSVCDTMATLSANTPTVGTGAWTLVSGSGTITSPNSSSSGVTGLGIGANVFRWTISNGVCATSTDDVVITRNALPANPTATGNLAICEGDSTTLTAASGATGASFEWWDASTGGSSLATTTAFATGPLSNSFIYWVEVTDSATGCTSDRASVIVTVTPLPAAPISAGDLVICSGDTIPTLSVTAQSGQIVDWYAAATGGTSLASGSSFTPTTGGTYYAEASDSTLGCLSTSRTAVTLTINPLPTVSLGGNQSVCPGTQVCFDAGPGFAGYLWSNGDTTQTICVTTAMTYTVTVTDTNGCQGTDNATLSAISAGIVAGIGTDTTACPTIDFTDQSSVTNALTWAWDFGDGNTSTLANPTHSYATSGNGTYTVTLIVSDSCDSDTTTMTVDISCIVGIGEGLASADVQVFPNPNTGRFKVSASGIFADQLGVRLTDLSGKSIYRQNFSNVNGEFDLDLDVTSVAKGVYFLILNDGARQYTRKVVIQ